MWNSTITRKNILTKSHWTRNRNYSRLRTFLGPLLWAIPSRQLVMENLKSYLYVHCQPTRKLWKVYSTRYLEKDWIMSSTWRGLLLMHSVSHSVHMVPTGPCFACEASMVFNTMYEQGAILPWSFAALSDLDTQRRTEVRRSIWPELCFQFWGIPPISSHGSAVQEQLQLFARKKR